MATQLQLRRGNTTSSQTFTGAMGEVTVNTQTHELTVHDGATVGGHKIPTKEWVEQQLENIPSSSIYFTPSVDTNGNLSWTNNGDLENPTTRNIRGPQGIPGNQGEPGDTGHTTNCITKIPQDIKLDLENGEITLKSGSKIHEPSGNDYIPDIDVWNTSQNNILGNQYWRAMTTYSTTTAGQWLFAIGDMGCSARSNLTTSVHSGLTTMFAMIDYNNGLCLLPGSVNEWCGIAVKETINPNTNLLSYKFVALSEKGYVSTTNNNMEWPTPTQVSEFNPSGVGGLRWKSIIYDGTQFVALDTHGYMTTSADGETWTTATANTSLGSHNWGSMIYDGTQYVAIGGGYTSEGILYIATSSDLNTWTVIQKTYTNEHSTDRWSGIAYDGTTYVAVSEYGYISTSTDRETWTTPSRIISSAVGIIGIVYIKQKFLVLCNLTGKIYVSNDAITWENWYCNDMYCYLNSSSIAYDGTKLVGLRTNGTIYTSADGNIWSEKTYTNTNYLVTNARVDNQNCMWRSIIYDGTQFIAISNHGKIATSENGFDWPIERISDNNTLSTNAYISSMTYDGTQYIATTYDGKIAKSSNITTWTVEAVPNLAFDTTHQKSIIYANGKYVILSTGGYISTSTDGINWTEGTKNSNLTGTSWTSITYDGYKFIAVGGNYISTSYDGINWTEAEENTYLSNSPLVNIVYNGTKLVGLSKKCFVAETTNSDTIPGFSESTLQQDITYSFDNENGVYMLFDDGSYISPTNCISGDTDSLSGQLTHAWYDTTNNIIKIYEDTSTTETSVVGFPVCIVTLNSGSVEAINYIFNGFGYIGSSVFMLPGTKGFIPNGRSNIDGGLNNLEFITLNTIVNTDTTSNTGDVYLTTDGTFIYYDSNIDYNIITNKNTSNGSFVEKTIFAKIHRDSGKITSFKAKLVFLIADKNDEILNSNQ